MGKSQIGRIERLACIGEITTEITHELNNQLTALLGYATMFRDTREAEYTDGLVRTCEDCCRIARGILKFAREGRVEWARRDLRRVLARPLAAKSKAFEAAAITVRAELGQEPMEALVDEFQIQQVVLNILHNAHYELMRVERRSLQIAGCIQGRKAVIKFQDSGRGFRKEDAERMFEPFFSTKPAGEGTGLGLSISRRIAKEHGGSLRAEGGNGGGATFILELPLVEETPCYIRPGMVYGTV